MKTTKSNRRNFLLAATAGSAAAAAAIVTAGRNAAPAKGTGAEAPGASGYRESEHIQKYYKTAKV